jgi:hypothetical protein
LEYEAELEDAKGNNVTWHLVERTGVIGCLKQVEVGETNFTISIVTRLKATSALLSMLSMHHTVFFLMSNSPYFDMVLSIIRPPSEFQLSRERPLDPIKFLSLTSTCLMQRHLDQYLIRK